MSELEQLQFAGLALSRRLERAEGRSNADFVEARVELFPESNAEWIEVAGAYAMYDGADSILTQTFGLGLFDDVSEQDMNRLEQFYLDRGEAVHHQISPLFPDSLLYLLNKRGYRPIEFTNVMFRQIEGINASPFPAASGISVRIIDESDHEKWARTSAQGWNEFTEFADQIYELGLITARRRNGVSMLAEQNGEPIATGSLSLHEGVALMAGASTIPEKRNQGAQRALLEGRLRYAVEQGCNIAMMCARPGSASQRNAERQGFRIAYTRVKWELRQDS